MISIREAFSLLSRVRPRLSIESVLLADALGRTLAQAIYASINLLPFARATMDGYALNSSECNIASAHLAVNGRVAAGDSPEKLIPGTAVRIFTGATLLMGADSVIEQEAIQVSELLGKMIIARPITQGRNVMPRWHQYSKGHLVYQAGERLTSSHLGTLVALGLARLQVFRRIRVGIVQTGNELTPAATVLAPGCIYEIQAIWLPLLIQEWGGVVTQIARIKDDLRAICRAVQDVQSGIDLVITTGGISVGDYDYVAKALETVGRVGKEPYGSFPPSDPDVTVSRHSVQATRQHPKTHLGGGQGFPVGTWGLRPMATPSGRSLAGCAGGEAR